jgi:hypothetical protein
MEVVFFKIAMVKRKATDDARGDICGKSVNKRG